MLRQKRTSWIDEANEHIDIADLLTSIGIFVPDTIRMGGTRKVHCPFGFYHSDGGRSKAMRIYPASNTVYCFSCTKRYSPVGLAAALWDISWTAAAMRLLEDAGFKRKSIEERWVEATTSVENKPDLIALADALKMFCAGISSDWHNLQYEDEIAVKLSRCLQLLDSIQTNEQATKWLTVCKTVMRNLLEEK